MTFVRSATQVLEMRFGIARTRGGKFAPFIGAADAGTLYGIKGLTTDPQVTGGLYTQVISGIANLARQATNPQWQYPTVYNPKINYSWLLGRHSLKIGYEYQRVGV